MNYTANIWKLYLIKISKWFMVFMPVIVLFYQSNGLNLRQVMTINAIYSLTAALFEIPSGYFSDRYGRKQSIILGTILIAAQFLIMSNAYTLLGFSLGAILGGLGSSFISGSDAALLYDSLCMIDRKDDYMKWEGRSYALGTFSEAIAAIIGGSVAYSFHLRMPIYTQFVISLVGVFAAFSLIEPPRKKTHSRSNWAQLGHILSIVFLKNKVLRFFILLTSLFGLASLILAWFAQPYLDLKAIEAHKIGYLWAAFNLTVAFFSYHAHRIQQYASQSFLVTLILLGFSLGYLVLGFGGGNSLLLGLSAMFCMYACRGIAAPFFLNIINQITPSDMRATVLSIRGFCVRLSYAFVAPLLGWWADVFSILEAFWLFGSTVLCLSLLALFSYRYILNQNRT
jgi:predicted MFS family arabinose efflux permease